jgi:hypothetical protein
VKFFNNKKVVKISAGGNQSVVLTANSQVINVYFAYLKFVMLLIQCNTMIEEKEIAAIL